MCPKHVAQGLFDPDDPPGFIDRPHGGTMRADSGGLKMIGIEDPLAGFNFFESVDDETQTL